ncbi:hypothetical protein O0I10_004842 [Lichtheimia ornata]|uniref:Uncharacterized protein n=1 Tax=Lichtheimia ornata TaxID=688661 RepID=A0AAD7V7S2_9FUNG|nr:uncharacterized protein O0I10_004842 [Lichtheimia ornata]KAJ8659477.1 hypothetical protein O0I10_004842 [Lichtheimia ornata]
MFSWSDKARGGLLESKWSKRFILLALLQVLITIPILIATLVNVETSPIQDTPMLDQEPNESTDYLRLRLRDKNDRVRFENIWFIVYELWKLGLMLDGLIYRNSLTVVAAAGFTFFSGALGIMQIIESVKWDEAPLINLQLQIAMTVIVWVLAVPTAFVAFMLQKHFGWDVIDKVGPERRLQSMYYTVQCFTLALKINFFFEVLLMAFYAVCASVSSRPLCIAASVLAGVGLLALLIGRQAIAWEAHWMMSLFSLMQGAIIFINMAVLVTITDVVDPWYTLEIYASASIVIVVCTLYIAVRCQIRFGQGLKPYVQWQLWSSFWKRNQTSNDDDDGDPRRYAEEELLGGNQSTSTSPSHNRVSQQEAQRHEQQHASRQRHDSTTSPPPPQPPPHDNHVHQVHQPPRRDTRQAEHIDFTEYFDYLDMIRRPNNNSNTSPTR